MIPLLLLAIATQAPPSEVRLLSADAVGEARAGGTVRIKVKVAIIPGWHIYAAKPDKSVLPTTFSFEGGATVSDTIEESAPKHDAEHGFDIHEGGATFTVPVRLPAKAAGRYLLKGTLNYQ